MAMNTGSLGAPNARFMLCAMNNGVSTRAKIADLPYRNIQSESFLNEKGQTLRVEIPFRGYPQVNQNTIYPGKTEIALFDTAFSYTVPVFQGPVWDATPSSSTGVVSVSAQGKLSYFSKRFLINSLVFSAQKPESVMSSIISNINSVAQGGFDTHVTASIPQAGTQNIDVNYLGGDRNNAQDLLTKLSAMGDGVDYYCHNYNIQLWGGKIKSPPLALGMEYGGALTGYSVQYNGQNLGNYYELVGNNGVVGLAQDTTNQNAYGQRYQIVDRNTDLGALSQLNTAAATLIKKSATTIRIPSIVTKKFAPMVDFTYGDQFQVVIDDEYTQYSGLVRVVGWQISIGQGDNFTVVIYTNDTAEIS